MTSFSGQFPVIINLFLLLLSVNYLNTVSTTDQPTGFDFATLTLTSLKLLGDAHLSNGSVKLTRDLAVPNSGAGKVLYSKPIRFRQPGSETPVSFSTFFSFSVTNLNPTSIGGGLAFVITPEDESLGDAGGFLGAMDGKGTQNGVVAIEFDTLMDVEFEDVNGNHVGLDLNSMVSTEVTNLDAVNVDLKSGNLVNSWVDYSGSTRTLNVTVSYSNVKPKTPILSINLNLGKYVNEFMFVGFSGSTQGSTEVHSIDWWSFSSSFDNSPSKSSSFVASPPPPSPSLPPPPPPRVDSSPPSMAPAESNHSTLHEKKSEKIGTGAVVGVVTASAFVLALFAVVLVLLYSKKFKGRKKSETLGSEIIRMPKEFTYKELKFATKGFNSSRIIGYGAFGTVYKGILAKTGDFVAVKRCSHNGGQGKAEFLSELSIIATLRHRNLVRLQGWCHEKGEILLVYDFMPNGSLDKALFESRMVLPWFHRRKILLNVASALTYLHQECENQVIHRDVKSSNIMLDEFFNARLGDFGLARQIEHDKSPDATVAAGTMGYLAPEYLLTGKATEKTDVFSYGAVVLEVASGRRPIERDVNGVGKFGGENGNLVEYVWSLHGDGKLLMAADEKLEGEFDEEEMRKVLSIGLICSHPDPMARPTMRGVVQMLIGECEIPIVPRTKPALSFNTSHLLLNLQDSVSDLNGLITISSSSSSEHSFSNGIELV